MGLGFSNDMHKTLRRNDNLLKRVTLFENKIMSDRYGGRKKNTSSIKPSNPEILNAIRRKAVKQKRKYLTQSLAVLILAIEIVLMLVFYLLT